MLGALKINPLVARVAEALAGREVYFVGGVVRDALLDKPCLDLDLVLVPHGTPAREFKKALALLEERFGVRAKRSQFFTGKLKLGQGEIDFALARKEKYPAPGSLPLVSPATSIEEDLARRDFTANAIAMTLEGEMIDPLDGVKDASSSVLRVIYRGSFRDDPTRALRAVRYKHQLGFSYSAETEAEFLLAVKHMAAVSFERIKHELARSSERPERTKIWLEMAVRGLVGDSLPNERALMALSERAPVSPESWVMFYGLVSKSIPSDLTRAERKTLACILRNMDMKFTGLGDAHEALRTAPEKALLALGALDPLVEKYRQTKSSAKPLMGSEEIKAIGFSGRELGRAILALEKARLEARVRTRKEEAEFLRSLM